MDKQLKIKDLMLGNQQPQRIIVPIVADQLDEVLVQAETIMTSPADLVEWRIDYFAQDFNIDQLIATGKKLKQILGSKPLIITNRTSDEGGMLDFDEAQYIDAYEQFIEANIADVIDVEYSKSDQVITHLKHLTDNSDTKLLLSHHDCAKTESKEVLIFLFAQMAKQNPDIIKVARAPKDREDVMALMNATLAADHQIDQPIIAMSMGKLGQISRIAGQTFGSVATFASLTHTSAPGQLPAGELRRILDLLQ